MRKQVRIVTATLCLLLFGTVLLNAQSLSWKPEQPKVGEKVSISYDPTGTPLAGETKIEAVAYCVNRGINSAAKEIHLVKSGKSYTGSFSTDTNTLIVTFAILSGDKKDLNQSKGYFLMVRDQKGQLQPGTYGAIATQYDGYGKYLYGLEAQPELSATYRQKEWDEFPANRAESAYGYFAMLYAKDKKAAETQIPDIMNTMISAGNLTEQQYNSFAGWYQRLKQKDKAEVLRKEVKEKFPDGQWKKTEMMNAFYAEQLDPVKKETLLKARMTAYPPKTEDEKNAFNIYYSNLASLFAQTKDETKRDLAKFREYAAFLPMAEKASLYNNVSWELALKDVELSFCKEISAIATKWAKKEQSTPTAKKPLMSTAAKWAKDRETTYAMYADTYGYIMYKLHNYNEGFPYVKDAAVTIKKKADPEYNDRYALLLEKVTTPAEVKNELEPLVKEGKAGKEVKAVLLRTLTKTMGSEQKATDYMAALGKASEEKAREALVKTMLNTEARNFKLKNMEGTEVSLAALKGKVVVVDFWATWCGPCKASFPGMQKAVEKYKSNENVVFLFIDTWENQPTLEQRKKEVSEFIKQNKYSFNVLYDETRKDDPDTYAVVSDYKVSGIPTKFIIGKDGLLKFQSVGFGGSDDILVAEISAMIDLAAGGN